MNNNPVPGAVHIPKRYFDEKNRPDDVSEVLYTASLLNIGEFRVFELAFKSWYGRKPDDKIIEQFFMPYMFNDRVPSWVRHFCRAIILRDEAQILSPRDHSIQTRQASYRSIFTGLFGFIGIVATLILLVVLANSASHILPLACTFPPCY